MDQPAIITTTSSMLMSVFQMDQQSWVSLALGTLVSLFLSWFTYRQTIGAKQERIRSANSDVISIVLRRLAVERTPMTFQHFSIIANAKAYRANIDAKHIMRFRQVLDQVFIDIVDTNFLDSKAKDEIISLIDSSGDTHDKHLHSDGSDFNYMLQKLASYTVILFVSSSLGAILAVVNNYGSSGLYDIGSEFLPYFVGVVTMTLAATAAIFGLRDGERARRLFGRRKEASSENPDIFS